MKLKKIMATVLASIAAFATFGFASCGGEETLVVYTEAGFAPFEYIQDGKIVGVDVDIMNQVGEKLGKKIVFENVGFDTIIDTVAAGKLCNVGAAGISVTPARQEKVDFSNEYYTAELYVIYQAAEKETYVDMTTNEVEGVYWGSLKGKRIAVQSGTTADLFLGDELADHPSDDPEEAWTGVLYNSGATKVDCQALATAVANIGLDADVLIIDELPAQQLIKGNANLACAPLYYYGEGEADTPATDTYAICVTKGQDALLTAINEVLAELGTTGIQALVNKHLGLE
jgi:polar amino acid transport system substrate-binding protein